MKLQVIFFKMSYMIKLIYCTKKFSIKDFFCKCDQIRRKLQIWSHLLKKCLKENLILYQLYLLQYSPGIDKLNKLRTLSKKALTISAKRSFLDVRQDSEYPYDTTKNDWQKLLISHFIPHVKILITLLISLYLSSL